MCCAMLFSSAQSEAATPGGLKPGTSFKLTVITRSSIKISQLKTDLHAPIPSEIPDFKKGQHVKFTIGSNGQLKADRMSIPIVFADSFSNFYLKERRVNSSTIGSSGSLEKRKKTIPTKLILTFVRASGTGFEHKSNTVSYVLE